MKAIATDSSPCRHRRWQKDGEEKLKKTFKGLMLPDFMSNQGIIRKLSVEKMCYNPLTASDNLTTVIFKAITPHESLSTVC